MEWRKLKWDEGLNLLGLFMNLVGGVFLFFWAVPSRVAGNGTVGILADGNSPKVDPSDMFFFRMGQIGLGLFFVGTALQMLAAVMAARRRIKTPSV